MNCLQSFYFNFWFLFILYMGFFLVLFILYMVFLSYSYCSFSLDPFVLTFHFNIFDILKLIMPLSHNLLPLSQE